MDEKKIKILLIDHDFQPSLLGQAVVSRAGDGGLRWSWEQADSLALALRRLEHRDIDLVLLDLDLPDSRGLETFESLRKYHPALAVILLNPSLENEITSGILGRGEAQDYLLKSEAAVESIFRMVRSVVECDRLRKKLTETTQRLEKLALMDSTTEVLNRRGLQEILTHEIPRAFRKQSNLLVLSIDLDDFQRINDLLGTKVGDVVLCEVAKKLRATLRATDYVARIGGDEFMVLLPDTRFAEGLRVAEKVRLAISSTVIEFPQKESSKVTVTASLGLANINLFEAEEIVPSINELILRARGELFKSKEGGKNRVSGSSSPDIFAAESVVEEIPSVQQLLRSGKTFHAVMQPIFRLSDMKEWGFEFLSRSSVKGYEMPADFLRTALETNILTVVDHQCLKICVSASATLPGWMRRHVNLFPSTMIGVPVEQLLEVFPQDKPGLYCVEISEQQIIGDPSYLVGVVTALKRAGILIAIDDLGFGRSCLESLILLEPDIVKIDKRCVTGIAGNPAHERSLDRLLKMASSLGAEVVAEGIESRSDFELLRSMGVAYGQGFFLGEPVATAAFSSGDRLIKPA
ncbi:MAG TPA: bifunctional diguanylate cyclase/phosphodiesterase [bacterium]|nr:bifunctional diguanylate cyclase/phosphodiesterase [bacterium]